MNILTVLLLPDISVIEEANWLTLEDDLRDVEGVPKDKFDAVLCFGNSFAHLPDFEGDLTPHRMAIKQFKSMIKPGGIFLIDHRNYDAILETGYVPHGKNVFYAVSFSNSIFTTSRVLCDDADS